MEGKPYEIVEALVPINPDKGKIIFANNRLRGGEIFRGPAKDWKRSANDGFLEFLRENNISPETQIAIAQDGSDAFAVIQIIKF